MVAGFILTDALTLNGSIFTNHGTLDAFNSGTININTNIFTNDGTVDVTNGSFGGINTQVLGAQG